MAEYDDTMVSEVFGEEKAEKAVTLLKDFEGKLVGAVDARVAESLADFGIRRRPLGRSRRSDKQLRVLDAVFKNNGVNPLNGERLGFDDLINLDVELTDRCSKDKNVRREYEDTQYSQEQPLLFPRVVTMQVREAIEPELNITPLFQVIRYTNAATLVFPAVSAMNAGDLTVGEGKEYKEGKIEFAGQVSVTIGKHGIKVSMTEECRKYSMFDLWAMNLRAAGRALARHKEIQAVNQALSQGTIYFNNDVSGQRHTTGRDASGGFNGTFTVWDLFDMAADMIKQNQVPDTIIMHPFAWPVFALDPVMRAMGFMHNGKLMNGYQGSPGSINGPGGLLQQRQATDPANLATTSAMVPSQYPFGPLRIIVSPHVDFDPADNTTDIFLCDSRDLGILVVDEEIVTEEWREPQKDITSVKFRERYSFGTTNLGRAIRIARGVVVSRGYAFEGGVLSADVTLGTSEFTNS